MRKWIPLIIIAAAFIASAVVFAKLPPEIPTHWDMTGHPNDYSSRAFGAWLLPVMMVLMWGLLRFLPSIDPRGNNYAKFGGAFEGIILSLMIFLLGLHIIILRAALGYPVNIQRTVPLGVGLLLVVIGNLLPRARPNWFVGIRTPWTLSSDRVWEKTHRLGGKLFVVSGVIVVISALAFTQWVHIVLFGVIMISVGVLLAYSYLEWKHEQQSSPAPTSSSVNKL